MVLFHIGIVCLRMPLTNLQSQVEYPEIEEDTKPRYRFMSAFEQRVEVSKD